LEKGFQAVGREGPSYIEEIVRPVRALILFGKPRLFLVRGEWGPGRYGQYQVARGTDYLIPERESDVSYLNRDTYDLTPGSDWSGQFLSEWDAAAAREAKPVPPKKNPEDAHDFLMEANGWINSAYHGFIGRASNDEVFRADDFKFADAAAAEFEREPDDGYYYRELRDGQTVSLIKRMIAHLEYLRDVYSADRETIKAWRDERIQAYDEAFLRTARNGNYEAFQASPEFKRWEAIRDVGALEYPLSAEERTRRDEERTGRAERMSPLLPAAVRPSDRQEER
jgi:hypothetical protein